MNADRRRPYEVLYCAIDVFSILFELCNYRFLSVSQESVHCSGVSFLDRQGFRRTILA